MTLDEAIKHIEEVADKKKKEACNLYDAKNYEESRDYIWCSEEHRQLAEWLKDYKRLLEQENVLDKIRAEVEALNQDYYCAGNFDKCKDYVLDILDEYRNSKMESEVKENG